MTAKEKKPLYSIITHTQNSFMDDFEFRAGYFIMLIKCLWRYQGGIAMFLSANRQLSCVKDRVCLPVRGCCFICMNKGEGYF